MNYRHILQANQYLNRHKRDDNGSWQEKAAQLRLAAHLKLFVTDEDNTSFFTGIALWFKSNNEDSKEATFNDVNKEVSHWLIDAFTATVS